MYLPQAFEQTDVNKLRALIAQNPLATLITSGAEGFNANHIPMVWQPEPVPNGVLMGHIARANSLSRDVLSSQEVLAIFHGPNAYISPQWYPAKLTDGRVVPTWNYAVVHVYGQLRIIDDASWIRSHIIRLTDSQEARFSTPWAVNDAPAEFTSKLLESVVGVELVVSRIVGKWKLSQNRSATDRSGVIAGLRQCNTSTALSLANFMEDE